MKKSIYILLVVLIMVSGCQINETTKTVCSSKKDLGSSSIVLEAKGNNVLLQTQTSFIDVSRFSEEELEEILILIRSQYEGIEGVTRTETIKDDVIIEVIELDYQRANLTILKSKGLIDASDAVETIGLKETVAAFKDLGYTCLQK